MTKLNQYKPGNPEYDFWNDKNLYPSLRHEFDDPPSSNSKASDDPTESGSILVALLLWIGLLAPCAFFLTWQHWLMQTIFWGGIVIILLVFAIWLYRAIRAERAAKQPPQAPPSDPDQPFYRKYPPADAIKPPQDPKN